MIYRWSISGLISAKKSDHRFFWRGILICTFKWGNHHSQSHKRKWFIVDRFQGWYPQKSDHRFLKIRKSTKHIFPRSHCRSCPIGDYSPTPDTCGSRLFRALSPHYACISWRWAAPRSCPIGDSPSVSVVRGPLADIGEPPTPDTIGWWWVPP